jgi:histidinol-phosphate aminotransferase
MSDSIERLVTDWIRPEIRALQAYHVQPSTGLIKLDAMENPYDWPAELRDEWSALLRETPVNRYPDPTASAVVERLRLAMEVPPGMSALLGNGSDELIQMITMALAGPSRCVLSIEPSFVMYRQLAVACGMDYVGVSLRSDDFAIDQVALLDAIVRHQPAVVFIAYPNNPTANLFDADAIRAILEAAPGLVVVDEAYAPFTDASFMPSLGQFDNLVVMRTVSKMGLAGLRLGILAGPAAWLDEFDKVRLPYNINVLTQVSAEFALRHKAVFDRQTQAIRSERSRLAEAIGRFDGVTVFPSEANFLLVRAPPGRATDWFARIRDQGVLIKLLHGSHPLLEDCLRPTVGKPDENQALVAAFAEAVARG